MHIMLGPVTEYLDPHDIWTPGPKFFEIFGPPLKFFYPHGFMNINEWTGLRTSFWTQVKLYLIPNRLTCSSNLS